MDVSLLDHGRQGLLGHAPGLQEAGEVGAFLELRDLQLDGAGPGLPDPMALAVALVDALR